jgi:hypothetical protein
VRPGRRGASAFATVAATAAVLSWAALAGADPPSGTVASYQLTPAKSLPAELTPGPDGRLWLIQPGADEIAAVGPTGAVTEYPIKGPNGSPLPPTSIGATGSTVGPLFFTEPTGDFAALAEISTAGAVSPTGVTELINPAGPMANDANGDLWIVHDRGEELAEVKPPYSSKTPIALPEGAQISSIAAGPDGQTMWFADEGTDSVGSVTQNGAVTEYPLSTISIDQPVLMGDIVLGPDGNVWVGVVPDPSPETSSLEFGIEFLFDGSLTFGNAPANNPGWLVRITGSGPDVGALTAFAVPSTLNADPFVLGLGPDGEIWMADYASGNGDLTAVGATGPTGATGATGSGEAFTDYQGVLAPGAAITSIVKDPGGADALWMTDWETAAVLRVQLQAPASTTGPSGTTGTTGSTGATGASGPGSTTPTTGTTASTGTTAPGGSTAPSAPLVTPSLGPVTDVSKSAAMVHGTISLQAGSAPTSVSYHFEYGVTTDYGSSTPAATTMATAAGVPVSAALSGLDPFTTYHYRLIASDCAAVSCRGQSDDQSFTTGTTLTPVAGTSVGAAPTSGEILIKLPGHHGFTKLAKGELVPLGATIDARNGGVLIESSIGRGEQASGRFSGGVFKVTQPRHGTVTVLVLQSNFALCTSSSPTAAPLVRAASAKKKPQKKTKKKKSKKVVNQVFGNAHGQFATQGQYATAADQGTDWRVSDRCDGTLIAVITGKVTVTDRVHHHTFVLKGGHSYLVPRP